MKTDGGALKVGLDDLAQRILPWTVAVSMPRTGQEVKEGEPVATLSCGDREVQVAAPTSGRIVAVNAEVLREPTLAKSENCGTGWLFKVRPTRWARNAAQLLTGDAAKDWVEEQGRKLTMRLAPEMALAPAMHDGGAPVHGMARELDAEHWDEIAREFFRTQK
jgi:glycine cleavage system H protein